MIKYFEQFANGQEAPVTSVRLEACSKCQLKCPLCPTAKGENRVGRIGWGHLKLEDFQRFVEANPQVTEYELPHWGEIFLNPNFLGMLEYAHRKGVSLTAYNGANLSSVSDEVLEGLVEYQFKFLTVAIDGASPETYSIYRRNGQFNVIIRNVKKINEYKRQYQSPHPHLRWQFIVFGHNEHELPRAKAMAEELGMSFRPRLSWSPKYSPLRNRTLVSAFVGQDVTSLYKLMKAKVQKDRSTHTCAQMWKQPQINWDGTLFGCCHNRWGDYGNVFKEGLQQCLKSERYQYAKGMLMGEKRPRKDIPCYQCHVYQASVYPRYFWKFLLRGDLSQLRYLAVVLKDIAEELFRTMKTVLYVTIVQRFKPRMNRDD